MLATQRQTRRTVCSIHGVEFGQEYSANTQAAESAWLPPSCPQCEADLREKILANEEMARQVAEIDAETDRRAAADPERDKRISEAVDRDMAEEAEKILRNFYATQRAEWTEYHENEDWQCIAARVKAEKQTELLEQLKKAR